MLLELKLELPQQYAPTKSFEMPTSSFLYPPNIALALLLSNTKISLKSQAKTIILGRL
jgi:hypothetical protein